MTGWRRFERASRGAGSDRFWSIRVDGNACEIRHGQVGAAEVTGERLEHASANQAKRTVKEKIRTKQLAGWVEVEQPDDARTQALAQGEWFEQAIAAEPKNLDNWSVYADWLQSVEPQAGERVALGLMLARAELDNRAQMQERIEALERTHARELFGVTLAGVLRERKFADVVALERQFGMIVGAELTEPFSSVLPFDGLLGALLELPLARMLTRLSIDLLARQPTLPKVAAALVARPHPALRSLTLTYGDRYVPGEVLRAFGEGSTSTEPLPELQVLLDRCPKLEQLWIDGAFSGDATHPRLRALKLRRRDQARVGTLSQWRLPALEILHVELPGRIDWSHVELPKLRQLAIECRGHGDELIERLAAAPVLAQLDLLVLTQTHLSWRGIQALIQHAERYQELRRLVVLDVDGALGVATLAQLRRALPRLIVRNDGYWETRVEDDPFGSRRVWR